MDKQLELMSDGLAAAITLGIPSIILLIISLVALGDRLTEYSKMAWKTAAVIGFAGVSPLLFRLLSMAVLG